MTITELASLAIYLTPGVLIFGLVLGALNFSRLSGIGKNIMAYLALMLFTEGLSLLLGFVFKVRNLIVLPVYSLIELCFFLYLYNANLFGKRHKVINVIGIVGALYILAELINDFILNSISPAEFQPYAKVVDNFIIVMLALTFLYEKMSTYTESRWENFGLNIVFLVFYTLNTIIFLPFNFLVNENSGVKFYFWAGNIILAIIYYSYLTYKIWRLRTQH